VREVLAGHVQSLGNPVECHGARSPPNNGKRTSPGDVHEAKLNTVLGFHVVEAIVGGARPCPKGFGEVQFQVKWHHRNLPTWEYVKVVGTSPGGQVVGRIGGLGAEPQVRVIGPDPRAAVGQLWDVVNALDGRHYEPAALSHKINEKGCKAPRARTGRAAGNKIPGLFGYNYIDKSLV